MNKVHPKEVFDINSPVTSKEEILNICREIVSENTIYALNMRTVAERCNIALGSLYNYFPSKDALIIATIESVWENIFSLNKNTQNQCSFPNAVEEIFLNIHKGQKKFPNFFTMHSVSLAVSNKEQARNAMTEYLHKIKCYLLEALNQDEKVNPEAFCDDFTREAFVDFIFFGLMSILLRDQKNCSIIIEVIKKTIY